MGDKVLPREAVLVNSFSVEPGGASVVEITDVNGDGRPEVVLLQTAGQLQSRVYTQEALDRCGIGPEDQALYCLTVMDMSGRVLWRDGQPWDRDYPFSEHGGRAMIRVEDLDGDGRAELAVVSHGRIRLLDAATGREKVAADLPTDNMVQLSSAQLGDPAKGRQILCRVNCQPYRPWEYANPTLILNCDLSVYLDAFPVPGAGHNVVPLDVDHDGRDELLIGYSLLDHDGRVLWSLDMGEGFDYAKEHADEIAVSDFNGDGKLEVRYAGSENLYITDLSGNLLQTMEAGHSQTTVEGPWGPGGERRLILSEKNLGLRGYNARGEQVWQRTDINGYAKGTVRWRTQSGTPAQWSLFRPQPRPDANRPTRYERNVAASHTLWPRFMDGGGRLYDVLPWDDRYTQPAALIRAKRAYDAGMMYLTAVQSADGRDTDDIYVYDRRRFWHFQCRA